MANHQAPTISIEQTTVVARQAVCAAAAYIAAEFRTLQDVRSKADKSLVSHTDQQAETIIKKTLLDAFPGDMVVGEESGQSGEKGHRQWLIDPIDGTIAFLSGKPTFTVLLALLEADRPVYSIVYQPFTREVWEGAYHNNSYSAQFSEDGGTSWQSLQSPAPAQLIKLGDALVASTGPQYFDAAQQAAFDRLSAQCAATSWGGDAYNYMLAAMGHINIVCEAGLKPHDLQPLLPILYGSGQVVTDWHGHAINPKSDAILVANTPKLHQSALQHLTTSAD